MYTFYNDNNVAGIPSRYDNNNGRAFQTSNTHFNIGTLITIPIYDGFRETT